MLTAFPSSFASSSSASSAGGGSTTTTVSAPLPTPGSSASNVIFKMDEEDAKMTSMDVSPSTVSSTSTNPVVGSVQSVGSASTTSSIGTADTVIQLKIYNKPVDFWKRRYKDQEFRYKISSVDMDRRSSEVISEIYDGQESSNINDLIQDNDVIKISIMKDGICSNNVQEQFGHKFDPDEFVLFTTIPVDQEKMAFMVDFYVESMDKPIPEHIGFSYILPSNLRGDSGSCTTPITGKKHLPIGQLSVEYLMIRPLKGIDSSYLNYPKSWRPEKKLDVGHRGAGVARRNEKVENVLENTVASFNYASRHGADMVELDVQLTKDLVPVIYHDYYVNIAMKKRRSPEDHEFLQIPIKDLSYHQLHQLKLSPVMKPNKQFYDFLEDDRTDNQPFPTLQTILDEVDADCGFNVEIKYPMQRYDGSWDATMDKLCDINQYVDIILKAIIEHAKDRHIVISCFHPDICALVAKKQTKYPILILTQGITKKWPAYFDPRTRSVQMATYFAISMGLNGINAHAEDLIKDRNLISFVKSKELILWCWGDDLNDRTLIRSLKQDGVDGVVYDKVDEYSSKEPGAVSQVFIPNHDPKEVIRDIISKQDHPENFLMSGFSWQSSGISNTSVSPPNH